MTVGPAKWGTALLVSVAIHASAAGWFYESSEGTLIEGGAPVQISMLGDAFQNELAAGDPDETAETVDPEIVKTSEAEVTKTPDEIIEETSSEVIETETVEVEITPVTNTEILEVVEAKTLTAQPSKIELTSEAEPIEQAPSELVAFADAQPTELLTPEIQLADINIASLQPILLSERTVSPALLEMEPVTAEPAKQDVIDKIKPEETEAQTVSPTIEKIEPEKPKKVVEPQKNREKKKVSKKKKISKKKKLAKKKPEKKSKKKAARGSNSKGRNNRRAGEAEGSKTAKKAVAGKSKGKESRKSGNASASNYKGKVRRKVKRSFRKPRSGGKARGDAMVRFVLSTSGAVRSVKLVRSSGLEKLDKAALAAVRRAAPFPKPPSNMRGGSLSFTLPFRLARR